MRGRRSCSNARAVLKRPTRRKLRSSASPTRLRRRAEGCRGGPMPDLSEVEGCPPLMGAPRCIGAPLRADRKSTRLNSSHLVISYAVFCLKKKKQYYNVLPQLALNNIMY